MDKIFLAIFVYIALFITLNLIFYWKQLKSKSLTKFFGNKAFVIWFILDISLLMITAVFILLFLIFYPQLEIFQDSLLLKIIGGIISVLGIYLAISATKQIGFLHSFNQAIFTRKKYKPKEKGVFKYFKHPMYFGWFLVFLAVTIFLNSVYILIFTIEGMIYFIIKSKLEEKELEMI